MQTIFLHQTKIMYRPILFLIFIILISSAQVILSELRGNDLESDNAKNFYLTNFHNSAKKGKIWVLELNDEGLDVLKMREASEEDQEDFEFYTEPLIKSYNSQHSSVVKKDAPKPAKAAVLDKKKVITKTSVSKQDIFKYLNKFALYSRTESDAYLSDSHEYDDASIALYFQGRFTSLIVKQGIRQWHYFIQPPSILPAWFYEDLTSNAIGGIITVPEDVTAKFYPALFRLLQVLLRYPV